MHLTTNQSIRKLYITHLFHDQNFYARVLQTQDIFEFSIPTMTVQNNVQV